MLDRSQFITRNPLEDFAIRFANKRTDFICDEVAVPKIVTKSQSKKYQFDLSNLKVVETQKDSKAAADKVDYGGFTSNLTTKLHKLATDVDPRDEKDFDTPVANLKQRGTATVMERLLIKREAMLVEKISTAANYPSGLTSTLAAGSTWADAGGDPVADSTTAKLAVKGLCGVVPDSLAISYTALEKLKNSPALIDRLKYTNGQSITEDIIKNLLGVRNLHVCYAQKNTAAEGAADAISDIWDDFALFYVKGGTGSDMDSMQFMRNFLRNQLYSFEYENPTMGSGDGRIQTIEMGWEFTLEAAAVVSSSDGDFIAGYLLDNVY